MKTETLTDSAEIRRALELIVEPGAVFELRAWGCLPRFKKGILSGYFDDLEKATAAAVLLSQGGTLPEIGKTIPSSGVYVVLNPVEPALLARSANRLQKAEGGDTTGDQHVTRRRWLLVDCDPARASGISASDTEKAEAHAKAKEIARVLREEKGFPQPVLADSGNGWHLLYRIDEEAGEESAAKLSALLKALAARFDSKAVHVDQKVFNASRISKLYGTGARKGDSTPDRPHRESRIEFIPSPLEIVTGELIDAVIVDWLPAEPERPSTRPQSFSAGDLGPFPMEEFIGRHGLDAGSATPYKGGSKWQLTCPFDSGHKKPDAALYVTSDGKPGFNCSHNSCQGRGMKELSVHLRDSEVLARFEKRANFSNSCRSPKVGTGTEVEREGEGIKTPLYKRHIENIEKIDKAAPWDEEPTPIGSESLPVFPVGVLPPVLRRFAVGVSDSVGTAPDLPGVLLLSAVAAAAQKRVAVRAKLDHVEPLTLWTVSIAPPGSRKSPIMARIRKPFAAHEAALNTARTPEIERSESEERVARKRLERAENDAAKRRGSSSPQNSLPAEGAEPVDELQEARDALKSLDPVRPVRLLADDATPEALVVLLSENGGRLAVLDPEGTVFGHMSGRYTQNPNIEVFLKSWGGEDFTSDRAGRDRRSVSVRRPGLTLGVAVQPSVIAALRGKKELVGVGALARCLFSFADDAEAADSYDTPPVPPGVEEEYRALIDDLLAIPASLDYDDGEPLPHFIGMDGQARAAFSAFYSEVRAEIHAEGEGLFAEWLAKCHGQALRIAGVLHMARHGKAGAEKPIDAETMEASFEIARYFMAHARAALARIREGEEVEDARRILAWVKRNRKAAQNPDGLPTGELRRQIRGIGTQEEMEAALRVLVSYGYAREIAPEEKPEGTPGRKPGSRWQFHPSITWEIEA